MYERRDAIYVASIWHGTIYNRVWIISLAVLDFTLVVYFSRDLYWAWLAVILGHCARPKLMYVLALIRWSN